MMNPLNTAIMDAMSQRPIDTSNPLSSANVQAPAHGGEPPNFESLLLSMMVKEMRQSMGSELFPGDESDILGSLFDMHLGEHMSQFAQLGLNQSLLGSRAPQPTDEQALETTIAAATEPTTDSAALK